jgi:acylphosphatase
VICRKLLVSGRVQGVFYRATAARCAAELRITGFARNLADGRVEVLACGEPPDLEAFVSRLWQGSSASKVTGIEALEVSLSPHEIPDTFRSA